MTFGDFKDLTRRKASEKILHDKAFNIAKSPKCDGYQRGLAWMDHKFFDKESSEGAVKNENMKNQELAEKYTNQLLQNLVKVYSILIDNIWGADLADMQKAHLIKEFVFY